MRTERDFRAKMDELLKQSGVSKDFIETASETASSAEKAIDDGQEFRFRMPYSSGRRQLSDDERWQ